VKTIGTLANAEWVLVFKRYAKFHRHQAVGEIHRRKGGPRSPKERLFQATRQICDVLSRHWHDEQAALGRLGWIGRFGRFGRSNCAVNLV